MRYALKWLKFVSWNGYADVKQVIVFICCRPTVLFKLRLSQSSEWIRIRCQIQIFPSTQYLFCDVNFTIYYFQNIKSAKCNFLLIIFKKERTKIFKSFWKILFSISHTLIRTSIFYSETGKTGMKLHLVQ